MATSVTESSTNTSELDSKIQECESQIAMIQSQINVLEAENADLIRKIASASVTDAATYRQQYNANKNRISSLTSEKKSWKASFLNISR
jgi:chromosome segregation ATPase